MTPLRRLSPGADATRSWDRQRPARTGGHRRRPVHLDGRHDQWNGPGRIVERRFADDEETARVRWPWTPVPRRSPRRLAAVRPGHCDRRQLHVTSPPPQRRRAGRRPDRGQGRGRGSTWTPRRRILLLAGVGLGHGPGRLGRTGAGDRRGEAHRCGRPARPGQRRSSRRPPPVPPVRRSERRAGIGPVVWGTAGDLST